MSRRYVTAWIPSGPPTWTERLGGALGVVVLPLGVVLFDPSAATLAVGFLAGVSLFATVVADGNPDGPASDGGLHPITVPGIVAGLGVVADGLGRLVPGVELPTSTGEQAFLGATLAFLVVVAAKTKGSRLR